MVYTYGYLFYVPISVFFAALFAVPGIRKKREAAYYFFALAAVLYINIAIRAAFFPMIIEDIPEWNLLYNINLIPNAAGLFSVHAVLNMLLTFPIGLGMQFVVNAKQKVLWAAVVLSSAFFEAGSWCCF